MLFNMNLGLNVKHVKFITLFHDYKCILLLPNAFLIMMIVSSL